MVPMRPTTSSRDIPIPLSRHGQDAVFLVDLDVNVKV